MTDAASYILFEEPLMKYTKQHPNDSTTRVASVAAVPWDAREQRVAAIQVPRVPALILGLPAAVDVEARALGRVGERA